MTPATPTETRIYRFVETEACNMCEAGPGDQALMGRRLDRRQGLWPKWKAGVATTIFRCRRCGLIYPNPMPLPARVGQHYDVNPEDYWPEGYFRVDPDYFSYQIHKFSLLTGRPPLGCSALDIGSGIGKAVVALGRAGFEVQGLEPSATFRRASVARMGVPEDRIQLASVEDAVYPEGSFDFINFAAVCEHLADPAGALRKLAGWLKPGGAIYVEVPSSAFLLSRLVRCFYQLTGSDYVINTCPMHVPYHLYEFSLESFRRHGVRSGYTVTSYEYFPCAGYMPRVLIKPFDSLMRWTETGMQLAVWLGKSP